MQLFSMKKTHVSIILFYYIQFDNILAKPVYSIYNNKDKNNNNNLFWTLYYMVISYLE